MENKKKYLLANANTRIWSRILDMILCFIIIISLDLIIVFTSKHNFDSNDFETWRYLLMAIVLICVDFFYFIIIPLINKKGTLFDVLFKLRFYNVKKNYFINLLRKELFIWIIPSALVFLLSTVLIFVKNNAAYDFIFAVLKFTWSAHFTNLTIFSIFFNLMFLFSALFLLFILINTIVNSKKHTLIDTFSNILVYSTKPIEKVTHVTNRAVYHSLPGVYDRSELED
ncbi:MAG: RDD family protein [Mycoplasmataceae bacterium]|jgi:uncharacterized RDD family membrane protein YckC|nr:RDD family protein [Mycoplasmataceae bacterium]